MIDIIIKILYFSFHSTRSNGRQFLRDFVAGPGMITSVSDYGDVNLQNSATSTTGDQPGTKVNACSTSGARLAAWLQPESRICPALCYIQEPNKDDLIVGCTAILSIICRDQYGEVAYAPDMKVKLFTFFL